MAGWCGQVSHFRNHYLAASSRPRSLSLAQSRALTHPLARLEPDPDEITRVLVGDAPQTRRQACIALDAREHDGDEERVKNEVCDASEHRVACHFSKQLYDWMVRDEVVVIAAGGGVRSTLARHAIGMQFA